MEEPHGKLHGLIAALLTPLTAQGQLDETALEANIDFVLSRGAGGVCVNGATGEYPCLEASTRNRVIALARRCTSSQAVLLSGIGAATAAESVRLGLCALDRGADALLLPPPHFFRYSQEDFASFYLDTARRIAGPILIYNLPWFTGEVSTELALRLLDSSPHLVGIKDSGPTLATLEALTARGNHSPRRFLGNDANLAAALAGGLCDGVISGVAGVLPELIAAVWNNRNPAPPNASAPPAAALDQFIAHITQLPVPWGLKAVAAARGLGEARFPLPLSESRQRELRDLEEWFGPWWESAAGGG